MDSQGKLMLLLVLLQAGQQIVHSFLQLLYCTLQSQRWERVNNFRWAFISLKRLLNVHITFRWNCWQSYDEAWQCCQLGRYQMGWLCNAFWHSKTCIVSTTGMLTWEPDLWCSCPCLKLLYCACSIEELALSLHGFCSCFIPPLKSIRIVLQVRVHLAAGKRSLRVVKANKEQRAPWLCIFEGIPAGPFPSAAWDFQSAFLQITWHVWEGLHASQSILLLLRAMQMNETKISDDSCAATLSYLLGPCHVLKIATNFCATLGKPQERMRISRAA